MQSTYHKVRLADHVLIGDPLAPQTFPVQLVGNLSDASLADLSWTPSNMGFQGYGYWPVLDETPAYNATTQYLGAWQDLTADVTHSIVTGTREVLELTATSPMRVSKIDFLRLFTSTEKIAWNKVKRQVAGMVEADYSNPDKALLVQAELALDAYDAIQEFIELDHVETIQFVGTLFVALDVVTPTRAAQVLSNTPL